MPPTKHRRGGGGEVGLANILESIVDTIVKDRYELSYLFVNPIPKIWKMILLHVKNRIPRKL